jgi:hypothetical protein
VTRNTAELDALPVLPPDAHARCVIHVIEVGYAHEHSYTDTLPRKQAQHLLLVRLLRHACWTVHADTPTTVLLGSMASIPATLPAFLHTLGVPASDSAALCRSLCVHAARSAAHLLHQYRKALTMDRAAPNP